MTRARRLGGAVVVAAVALCAAAGPARAQGTPGDTLARSRRFNTGQDPTKALSQFQPFLEWNGLPGGVQRWEIAPDGVYAFNAHLQVLGQLPYIVQTAGDAPGATSSSGLGDLYLQPSYTFAFHQGKSRVRGLVGVGITANTGEEALGTGSWVFLPQVGVSIPIGKRVNLITVVGYQVSAWEDPGVAITQNVVTSEYFIFHLPKYWYSILQVNPVYIVPGAVWTNVVTLQAGKFLGNDHRFGPSLQVSFNGGQKTSVYPYSTQVQLAANWLYPKGQARKSP